MKQTSFFFGRALGCAAILSLAACGSADAPVEAPVEEQVEPAIELGETGLSLSNARMVMAPVTSNPAAVYFELENGGESAVSLEGVEIRGVQDAKLHSTEKSDDTATMSEIRSVEIAPGETLSFAPGGNHVMAFNVSPAIGPRDRVNVTLKLSGGQEAEFKAEVRSAGDER